MSYGCSRLPALLPHLQGGKAPALKAAGGSAKKAAAGGSAKKGGAASRKAAAAKQAEQEEEQEIASSEEEQEQLPQGRRSRSGAARLAADKAAAGSKGERLCGRAQRGPHRGVARLQPLDDSLACCVFAATCRQAGSHALPAPSPSSTPTHALIHPSSPAPPRCSPPRVRRRVRAAPQPGPHPRQARQGRQGGQRRCRCSGRGSAQVAREAHARRQRAAGGGGRAGGGRVASQEAAPGAGPLRLRGGWRQPPQSAFRAAWERLPWHSDALVAHAR